MNQESEFERLLNEHKGILYKVSRAYGEASGSTDDLAQEIAIQLWRGFRGFDPGRAKFSTWMYRVALNVAISFQRRERVRTHEPLLEATLETAREETDDMRMLYGWIGKLERPVDRALILL